MEPGVSVVYHVCRTVGTVERRLVDDEMKHLDGHLQEATAALGPGADVQSAARGGALLPPGLNVDG